MTNGFRAWLGRNRSIVDWTRNFRPREILAAAITFGLLAGCLESLRHLFVKSMGGLIGYGPDVYWMAPLAEIVVFAPVGALLAAAAMLFGGKLSARWTLFLLGTLATVSVLLSIRIMQQTSWIAIGILAAGIGFQSSRVMARHVERLRRAWMKLTMGLVLVVMFLAAGVWGTRSLSRREMSRNLPAPPTGAPNVILLTLDTVRADGTSLHGYDRATTPRLAAFAREGATFLDAFATAPYTLPSHASMLTGCYPSQTSVDWTRPLDGQLPTLAERLSEAGYATGGFVANTIFCGYEFGLDRGFHEYRDYAISWGQLFKSSSLVRMLTNDPEDTGAHIAQSWLLSLFDDHQYLGRKSAQDVNREFFDWLEREGRRPFFAFLNYFDAHHPYDPPAPYVSMFRQAGAKRRVFPVFPSNPWTMTREEIDSERDRYDGAVRYLDDAFGELLDGLARKGLLDDTLVVVTSDHGEQFGEHGLFLHGNSLYTQLLHVPLVLRLPTRVPAGTLVDQPVSLRDLPATILDLVHVAGVKPLPGKSLAVFWNFTSGPPSNERDEAVSPVVSEVTHLEWVDWYPVSKGDMTSIRVGDLHYISGGPGMEALFDLTRDPREEVNLMGTEEGIRLSVDLRKAMTEVLGEEADVPSPMGEEDAPTAAGN